MHIICNDTQYSGVRVFKSVCAGLRLMTQQTRMFRLTGVISKGSVIIKPQQTVSLVFCFESLFFSSSSHITLLSLFFLYILFGPVSALTNGYLTSLFSDGLEHSLLSHWYTHPRSQAHTHQHTHAHTHAYTEVIVSLWTQTEFCSDPSLSRDKQSFDRHRERCCTRKWK